MQIGLEVLGLDDVVYERSGRWWAAEYPGLPGAYSQGRTKAAAYRNLLSAMRDIIDTYIIANRKCAPYHTKERKAQRYAPASQVAARRKYLREIGARELSPEELKKLREEHEGLKTGGKGRAARGRKK
jgi:hypothetical protein